MSEHSVQEEVIACPCNEFESIRDIYRTLHLHKDESSSSAATDQISKLVDWLSGKYDEQGFQQKRPLSCNASHCKSRIQMSLSILNEIRDACRPFLDSSSVSTSTSGFGSGSGEKKKAGAMKVAMPYETAFPSLGSSKNTSTTKVAPNIIVGRKKSKGKAVSTTINEVTQKGSKKAKKRIRPATIAPDNLFGTELQGNLINLPSEKEPLGFPTRDQLLFPSSVTPSSSGSAWMKNTAKEVDPSASTRITVTPPKEPASSGEVWINNISSSSNEAKKEVNPSMLEITPKTAPSPVPKETKKDIASIIELQRLVDVYCALVRSSLVPSTALELHLLLRLLTITNESAAEQRNGTSEKSENDNDVRLSSILANPARCTYFASQALGQLIYIIGGIGGNNLLAQLVNCPHFRTNLPETTRELEVALANNQNDTRGKAANLKMSVGSQTAILTVPFEKERDSRHNYKSKEEQALYKNREETRDSFLYQLRAFLNVRGKVVDASKAENDIQRIRKSSRMVVDALMESNLSWFSEFFCDLLLQIGHVPLEETDKDLLNIAGKEKLQKLHRRFSSKPTQANKSTKKIMGLPDSKRGLKAISPEAAAQQHFPGHQEFFFIFLRSTDSYRLSVHLKSELITRLLSTSNVSERELEKKMMDSRLVARFLGLLAFSPNWQMSEMAMHMSAHYDGLHQLSEAGLVLFSVVEEAWKNQNLVLVVPFVVELLRMTTWDAATRKYSVMYVRLIQMMRQIHITICTGNSDKKLSSPAREFIIFFLETLFDEVVGLVKTRLLLPIKLPTVKEAIMTDDHSGLDLAEINLNRMTLFSSNPHVEELFELISNLSRTDLSLVSLRSPGVTKKLRPVTVSPVMDTVRAYKTDQFLQHDNDAARDLAGVSSKGTHIVHIENHSINAKLGDTFFHQHRELKELCEFAVDRVLRNCFSQLPSLCIKPLLEDSFKQEHTCNPETKIMTACCTFLETCLERDVRQALKLLAPPATDAKVIDTAASLAILLGMQVGRSKIGGLVQCEVRIIQEMKDREKPRPLSLTATFDQPKQNNTADDYLATLTKALVNLRDHLSNSEEIDFKITLLSIQDLVCLLDENDWSADSRIPSETCLRSFFQSVLLLDQQSRDLIKQALSSMAAGAKERFLVLDAYLRATVKLKQISRHGLRNAQIVIAEKESLEGLIKLGLVTEESAKLAVLLADAVKARIFRKSVVEESLLLAQDQEYGAELCCTQFRMFRIGKGLESP